MSVDLSLGASDTGQLVIGYLLLHVVVSCRYNRYSSTVHSSQVTRSDPLAIGRDNMSFVCAANRGEFSIVSVYPKWEHIVT